MLGRKKKKILSYKNLRNLLWSAENEMFYITGIPVVIVPVIWDNSKRAPNDTFS